jgi:hypothetical protein
MSDDAEELRKRRERAAAIREQIASLTRGGGSSSPDDGLSPRDLIEKRMRELDRDTPPLGKPSED